MAVPTLKVFGAVLTSFHALEEVIVTISTQQHQNMLGLQLIFKKTGGDPRVRIRQAEYLEDLAQAMFREKATSYRTLRRILKKGLIDKEPIPDMKKGFYLCINSSTEPHLRNLIELIKQEKERD